MRVKAIHQDVQFSIDTLQEGILIKIKDNLGKIDTIKDNFGNFDAMIRKCETYLLTVNYVDRYGKLKELKLSINNIVQEEFFINDNYLIRVNSSLLNPELFKVGTSVKLIVNNQLTIEGLILVNEGDRIKIVYNKQGNLVTRYITSEQFLNEEVYLLDK